MASTEYASGPDNPFDTDNPTDTDLTDTDQTDTDNSTDTGDTAPPVWLLPSRIDRAVIAVVRVGVGLLWLQNLGWKTPPNFGKGDPPDGLYLSTTYAVSHEVLHP